MGSQVVGLYARVSSEKQAEEGTIESQLSALRERIAADGFRMATEHEYVDEGFSGATLIRPSLERLRDQVARGGIDRLYVHSPDRLARKYSYQALLLEEFQRHGLEVVFLNHQMGESPEADLLLQMQGMIAEYERAKITERSRRGKRYAAQIGRATCFSNAPFGYRYCPKQSSADARLEIVFEEAQLVRQMFRWVGHERLGLCEVARRAQRSGLPTRRGSRWHPVTIWGMLRNPAYTGSAGFGKTRVGPSRPRLRPRKGASAQPRRTTRAYPVPTEQWIRVPVPPIVEQDLFDAVRQQLQENRETLRQRRGGARHLLQGLLVCMKCGYAYCGQTVRSVDRNGEPYSYGYYRCLATQKGHVGHEPSCENPSVIMEALDEAVWNEVKRVLSDPSRIEREYKRRLAAPPGGTQWQDPQTLSTQMVRLRKGISRLIDSFAEGLLEKAEFEPRLKAARERLSRMEEESARLADAATAQAELQRIVGRLEEFSRTVQDKLGSADWNIRRDLIRAVAKRVEIDGEEARVVFRITDLPLAVGQT